MLELSVRRANTAGAFPSNRDMGSHISFSLSNPIHLTNTKYSFPVLISYIPLCSDVKSCLIFQMLTNILRPPRHM